MASKLFLVLITTALINNVVLSQFLGICPFLGVLTAFVLFLVQLIAYHTEKRL